MKNGSLPYWNHNSAYYKWVKAQTANCTNILDVGCGNGTLAEYLSAPGKIITGIDIDQKAIENASKTGKAKYLCSPFCDFEAAPHSFDAVIFVASLHHMDAEKAIHKARSLLSANGMLIIVGLASPTGFFDYLLEILRIIPSRISSYLHQMKSSESLGVQVSYSLPGMSNMRKLFNRELKGAKLQYGLHYRYLLTWHNN